MITEIDAGHVIYDDLELMGLERRLKGHLTKGGLEGERPLVGEKIPDEGMIVIIPKRMSADKTYFNDCTIEVNILLKDITHALQRTGGMYLAVTADEEMITDVTPVVHLHVVVVKLMHGVRVVAAGCAAVYHNHCNFSSHKLMFLMFQHCKDKTFS